MWRATVLEVKAPGWVVVSIPKLYRDDPVGPMQSAEDVNVGERVIVADLAPSAKTRDWWVLGRESQIGMGPDGPTGAHTHPQADVIGLVAALADLSGRGPVRDAFTAAMRGRVYTPVRIVCAGSSTMNGGNASSLDRRLVDRMSALTSKNPVKTDLADTAATDVQWWEIANGGTQSSNYITDAQVTQLGTLKPGFMLHSIGSNDYSSQVDPATYKTRLKGWLDKIQAVSPGTRHVYIAQHPRNDVVTTRTRQWWQYTVALNELAAEYPAVVQVADFGDEFEKIGLPGPDVWGLVSSDNVHLADQGNRYLAHAILDWLRVPRPPEEVQRFATTGNMVGSGDYTGPRDLTEIVIPPAAYPRTGIINGAVYYGARTQSGQTQNTQHLIEFAVQAAAGQGGTVERHLSRANSWQQTAIGATNSGQTHNWVSIINVPPHETARYYLRLMSGATTYISGPSTYTRAYVELNPA